MELCEDGSVMKRTTWSASSGANKPQRSGYAHASSSLAHRHHGL
jgi:hypothetical protein